MTRQWSRGEKWLMLGSGGLCLSALVFGWIYQRQNELPPPPQEIIQVPTDTQAIGLLIQAVGTLPPTPPTSTAVGLSYKPTGFDEGSASWGLYRSSYNKAYPLAKKVSYLKASQTSLSLWRRTLTLPRYIPDNIRDVQGLSYAQMRLWVKRSFLFSTVKIQARACWQRGDNDSALDWLLDLHRCYCQETNSFYNGSSHPRGYFALPLSARFREQLANEIKQLMPHLSAAQLRHAALELQKNRTLLPSVPEAMHVTESRHIARVYKWCARNDLRLSDDEKHPELSNISAIEQLQFRWANKKLALSRVKRQFDWSLSQFRLPAEKRFFGSQYPDDIDLDSSAALRRLSFYNVVSSFQDIEKTDTQEVVLLTAMAVRAFELEQGHNPLNLHELVPKYLKKVDVDPAAPAQQLRYSSSPKSYIQWMTDKPIRTIPLPANSVPVSQVQAPPYKGVTGYQLKSYKITLPFLLYSVGANGRDDGGMDFRAASMKPGAPVAPSAAIEDSVGPGRGCDDVLAAPEWFVVTDYSERYLLPLGGPGP